MSAVARDWRVPSRRVVRSLSQWPPENLLAMGLLGLYLALLRGHFDSIDGLVMYRQATSLVLHRSIHLVPTVSWGGPIQNSWYGIGQSLLYVPFIGLGHLLGIKQAGPSTAGTIRQYYADPLWTVSCSWMNAVITAVTACYVGKCLRILEASRAQIILGVLGFGLGSVALTYSESSFAQPLVALTCVLAVVSLLRWTASGPRNRLLLAALVGYCLITRPAEGVMLGLASWLYLVARRSPWSAWVWPFAGLAAGAAVDLAVNWLRFGSAFETGYGNHSWRPIIAGVLGLSISPARGVVWFMPFCVLVPWGFYRLLRSARIAESSLLAAITVMFFMSAAFWDVWWGGVNWGPRLLLPALPLLAVIAAFGIDSPRMLALGIATVVSGFILVLPTILVDVLAGSPSASSSQVDLHLHALPLLSAWTSLHRVVPLFATDRTGIDILWIRFVHHQGPAVLLVPLAFLALATWCFILALRQRPSDARIAPVAAGADDAQPTIDASMAEGTPFGGRGDTGA